MKKLFALVLTLALVFAIAAPAMAAGMGFDAPTTDPTTYENISVVVTQLGYNPATSMSGYYGSGTYYPVYTPGTGVVQGVPVRFAVDIAIPGTDAIQGYNAADFSNLNLVLALANLQGVVVTASDITTATPATIAPTVNTADKKYTIAIPALDDEDTTKVTVMVTGTVAASGKDATATATLSGGQTGTTVTFTKNSKNYSAVASGTTVTITNTAANGAIVIFNRNATSFKILGMTVDPDGSGALEVATVGIDAGLATFTTTAGRLDATAAAPYQAALNEIFSALGFAWSSNFELGYFSDANVTSLAAKVSVPKTITWKAYTANLTVTDGTNVPNTGDNMSVIGFVMVGLALLATAAVVVKKVRA